MTGPLAFGVFPLGLAGGPDGLAAGPPDDLPQIGQAMERLRGAGPPLLTRTYVGWAGAPTTPAALEQVAALTARPGTDWDLVLAYRDPGGDTDGYAAFVSQVVAEHGRALAAIQVTGEANLTHVPAAADGANPGAASALARGVLAARAAKDASGATAAIGFAVVPEIDPAASGFWPAVRQAGGADFAAALDYAGLDMYPDVFGPPTPVDQLDGAVDWLLRSFREQVLPIGGIGATVPIRVCENGWPTGPGRSGEQQADVLEAVVRGVHARRGELNVTHWELFALRDADSSRDGLFHHFGVLRDDYSAKPAFDRLRGLIAELG